MKTQKFFVLFLIAIMFTGLSGLVAGCNFNGIQGNGDIKKESRKISSFNSIEVSGAFKVFLKQGVTEELVVETDENILPIVRTEVKGSKLTIETTKSINHVTTLKVYITFKELSNLNISGAVDIFSEEVVNVPELSFDASGASDIRMELNTKKLFVDCSGASKIKLNGTANNVKMDLSGASDVYAQDLVAESYDLEISGAGKAEINVTKSLSAKVSGAGTIKYKGSPSIIDQDVSGAGSIKKIQ